MSRRTCDRSSASWSSSSLSAAEVAVRRWNATKRSASRSSTRVTSPWTDLVAELSRTPAISLGTLAPGQSTKVWFSAAGKGPLKLEFTQKGNPLQGFQVDDFDPDEHRRDGLRLVLVVKNNQVERFVEDGRQHQVGAQRLIGSI